MPEPIEIRIPDLPDISRIVLSRWLVLGDAHVKAGEEILELDSDKASVAFAAPSDGVLEQIAVAGRPVLAGQLVGRIHVNSE